jgi:glycerol-3-phosphate dehydrogenase
MQLDVIIFGGGVAGLWLLDRLTREGNQCLLLEAGALGAGQTIAAQGIIHGGMKYSLQGLLSKSARNIREMPAVWRDALLGRTTPVLTHTRVRANECFLWQTDSLASRAGMLGARLALQVTPELVDPDDRPAALAKVPGAVSRLPEQVICVPSLLADLTTQYRSQILQIDALGGLSFELNSPGEVRAVVLKSPTDGRTLRLRPRHVVFTAGAGNSALRQLAGLDGQSMQRRPLHMVLVRGSLPTLNGHCVDGARTRVTVTSDVDDAGRTIWQVGGQLAEDGTNLESADLIRRAGSELRAVLPGIDFAGAEWSTYRVDRAEGVTSGSGRPDNVQVLCAGNVTTGWPAKLALAPVLAREIAGRISAPTGGVSCSWTELANWPRPPVATPLWNEQDRLWLSLDDEPSRARAA